MSLVWVILAVVVVGAVIVSFFVHFMNSKITSFQAGEESRLMDYMRQDLGRIETNMTAATTRVEERLTKASEYISELNKEIGQMREIGQSVKNFQSLFASPKLRGGIGEQVLKELLELSLPKNMFDLQYGFKDGTRVDAVIRVKDGLIPIDSKFPLPNYQLMIEGATEAERNAARREFAKDVKKHIDDIAAKYIQPTEGTLDFALMYLPSESVHSAIIDEPALMAYANTKKIGIVSPNHFYHFLKTIMMGFQAQRVSEAGQKILEGLKGIATESGKFSEDMGKLNTHLTNAKNMSEQASLRFGKLNQKIDNLISLQTEEKASVIELEQQVLADKEIQ